MDFKALFIVQVVYSDIHITFQQMKFRQVIISAGKSHSLYLSVKIQTEVVILPEMNLCPSLSGSQHIAFNDG